MLINFLRHWNYIAEEIKKNRHFYGKWYAYWLRSTVLNYNLTIYDIYLPKKIMNANPYQIDDVQISFPDAFDNIGKLLNPSTDIRNNNEKTTYLGWVNELAQVAFSSEPLEFNIEKAAIKSSLYFQLTNVNGTNVMLTDKKGHDFSITKIGKKRKRPLMDPLETLMIRALNSTIK